jgi:trans-feruloyl-CoA hydratase/vanillin synthase
MLLAPRDALYMVMAGEPFDGKRASEMRLVNSAVPAAQLDEATLALAEKFKQKNPAVLAACKEAFRIGQNLGLEDAVAWERAMWSDLDAVGNKTWMKGVKQFKEKSYRPGLETYKWDK